MLDGHTLVCRSPTIVASEVDGELLMMSIDRGRYHRLNEVARVVWTMIARPIRLDDLIADLAERYDAPRDVIAEDVADLLTAMAARGAVQLSGGDTDPLPRL